MPQAYYPNAFPYPTFPNMFPFPNYGNNNNNPNVGGQYPIGQYPEQTTVSPYPSQLPEQTTVRPLPPFSRPPPPYPSGSGNRFPDPNNNRNPGPVTFPDPNSTPFNPPREIPTTTTVNPGMHPTLALTTTPRPRLEDDEEFHINPTDTGNLQFPTNAFFKPDKKNATNFDRNVWTDEDEIGWQATTKTPYFENKVPGLECVLPASSVFGNF